MANICETNISVVGLKEPPETFVKALSKALFEIDLDDMDVEKWGCNKGEDGKFYQFIHVPPPFRLKDGFEYVDKPPLCRIPFTDGTVHEYVDAAHDGWKQARREVDPKTWYARLVEEQDISPYVLYPREPFVKCGVSVPRFYVETKWEPPYEQVKKASEAFPDLLFHVRWFIEQDGPSGEFVLKGGKLLERTESGASWYLFDELKYPSMSLLPKYVPLALAQRGAAAVDDAIQLVKRLHFVIHDPRFAESRYQPLRDVRKFEETRETLDALLAYMEEAAKSLTFEGVLLPDMTDEETVVHNEEEDLKRMNVDEVRP
jgi:hypothetical protein